MGKNFNKEKNDRSGKAPAKNATSRRIKRNLSKKEAD